MSSLPLVSCLMPTYNRREFIPRALAYFFRQDYVNKELIIIDDSDESIADLVPESDCVRYYRLDSKLNLGAKLNMACRYAKGDILVNWDDDDWYAGWRLSYQVGVMLEGDFDVCGINQLLYYDLRSHEGFLYSYPSDQRVWLLGSSQCFTRQRWERGVFAEIDVGMDGLFVWACDPRRVKVLPDHRFSVHMIHDRNASPKKTDGWWWHPHAVDELAAIMGADYAFYRNGARAQRSFRNVYICLVHERKDSVVDLVRNLQYCDPESAIMLYNGGLDADLLSDDPVFRSGGVLIHPAPRPMQHGYLHGFALDCMELALEELGFDAMTIVDSDQLCLRKGYTAFLSAFFSDPAHARIGLLSSQPERVDRFNRTNMVALQAFREYELWLPFIREFDQGEAGFVHWTFWPGSVFTRAAVRDLVQLFKTSASLLTVMGKTRIWATEEVILPTLVRLLGYEIAANPCDQRWVNYKKTYTMPELAEACVSEKAFWIHPVDRVYEHPLREDIRHRLAAYRSMESEVKQSEEPCPLKDGILQKMRHIQGWLTDPEAELLVDVAMAACGSREEPAHIVEVGSFHGRSTVVLGSIAKHNSARVYSIDAHDGRQGAVDTGLRQYPPSWDSLQQNIRRAALEDVVDMSNDKSYSRPWEGPVDMLLIDGLHDYFNVARDFRHFSDSIVPGGYVAFHDHADYFPGVKLFVHELLEAGGYQKIGQKDSLLVLQKK